MMLVEMETEMCRDCVCFARSRRVCALAWWLEQVALSQVPAALEDRGAHCPPKAAVCRWFTRAEFLVERLEPGLPSPSLVLEGTEQVWVCPVPRCDGTVVKSPKGRLYCCACGAGIRRLLTGEFVVRVVPRGVVPARVERLIGFVPMELGFFQSVSVAKRTVYVPPDFKVVKVNRRGLTIGPKGVQDRRRWRHHRRQEVSTVLLPYGSLTPELQRSFSEYSVKSIEYALPEPVHNLEGNAELVVATEQARGDSVWLFIFNLALALSQFVRTVVVTSKCGVSRDELVNVLFAQLDVLVDGLGGRHRERGLTRNDYRRCEGRMSWVREDYVRSWLQVRLTGIVGSVGRSVGRKVEVEAGEPKSAAQSRFDVAKNWVYRTIRLWLRTLTANVGFGWRAPWLFNHRLVELGLHLDLEEVPKMAADTPLIEWFLTEQLKEEDFLVGRDRYLMPIYVPLPEAGRWLREKAVTLLEEQEIWYNEQWQSLLTAHRHHITNLRDALLSGKPNQYTPLMLLTKNLSEEQREWLTKLGDELKHRLHVASVWEKAIQRLLEVWEAWLQG